MSYSSSSFVLMKVAKRPSKLSANRAGKISKLRSRLLLHQQPVLCHALQRESHF